MTAETSAVASGSGFESFPFQLRGIRRLLFWLGLWTFLGMLQAARLYVAYHSSGEQLISWPQAITWALADWYLWGLLSLVIFRLTRYTEFRRDTWPRDVAIHLVAAFVVGAVQLFLYALVYRPLGTLFEHRVGMSREWTYLTLYEDLLRGKMHAAVLTYFLIAFIYFALRYHARYRSAEQRRFALEAELNRARLDALQMQLQPHFLFNTLNTISSLIHTDPEAADRMTGQLGELLRQTLETEGVQEVPLRQELQFLERYLEIQRTRFADRLKVRLEVGEEALAVQVPNLILQPLVENAIRHGIAPATGGGTVTVTARRRGDRLQLVVADDGAGGDVGNGPGRGLANVRARLLQLYGPRQELRIVNNGPDGFEVRIDVPWLLDPVNRAP